MITRRLRDLVAALFGRRPIPPKAILAIPSPRCGRTGECPHCMDCPGTGRSPGPAAARNPAG